MAKKWEKPMLIVLARRNPGEAVLVGCKIASLSGSFGLVDICDQTVGVGGCDMTPAVFCTAGACSNLSSS